MNFILISDLHLVSKNPVARIDDLSETQWDKLEFVLKFAKQNNCTILQAGDWHDSPRSYSVLSRELQLLRKYTVPIFAVRGQHDQYFRSETNEHTNFGILCNLGCIHDLSKIGPFIFDDTVSVYGVSWGDEIPTPKEGYFNILVIHASICEKPLFNSDTSIDATQFVNTHYKYDMIICGDIHSSFFIMGDKKNAIMNTGPMVRKDASEYNLLHHTPGFYYLNLDDNIHEFIEIPHEKGIHVLSRDHINTKKEIDSMLTDFVESIAKGTETKIINIFDMIDQLTKTTEINDATKQIISDVIGECDETQ